MDKQKGNEQKTELERIKMQLGETGQSICLHGVISVTTQRDWERRECKDILQGYYYCKKIEVLLVTGQKVHIILFGGEVVGEEK